MRDDPYKEKRLGVYASEILVEKITFGEIKTFLKINGGGKKLMGVSKINFSENKNFLKKLIGGAFLRLEKN